MAKGLFWVATLALIAVYVSCALADNRPVVEAWHNGLKFTAPVYEDVLITEAKWKLDVTHLRNIKEKLLDVTNMVIVQRSGYFSVAARAWGFIGLVNNLINASKELAQNGDPSPREKPSYGQDMSKLVEVVLATKADYSDLSDQETYELFEDAINGIEKITEQSPVGLYMDWSQLTINGQSMPEYFAPIIYWMHQNGYGMLLSIVGMVGKLFVKIGC